MIVTRFTTPNEAESECRAWAAEWLRLQLALPIQDRVSELYQPPTQLASLPCLSYLTASSAIDSSSTVSRICMSIPYSRIPHSSESQTSTLDKARAHSGSSGPHPGAAASPVPTGPPRTETEIQESEQVHDEQAVEPRPGIPVDDENQSARPFQPFFTLVEDRSTQTTVHPSVTYIFADDEHDPVTEAAIRIKQSQTKSVDNQRRRNSQQQGTGEPSGDPSRRRQSTQVVPVTSNQPNKRYILVTLGADGRSVESAQSLTADWHVDDAELTPAPTLDSDGVGGVGTGVSPGTMNSRLRRVSATVSDRLKIDEERERLRAQQEDGPLMLRLHGRGLTQGPSDEEAMKLGLDGLRNVYLERLEELRQVIAAGENDDVAIETVLPGESQQDETS